MTPAEFKAIRNALGYTQGQLAEALADHWSTVQRWESGTRKIPPLAARVMRMEDAGLIERLRKS